MVENRAVSLVGEKSKMILARHRPEPSSAHAVGQLGIAKSSWTILDDGRSADFFDRKALR